MSKPIQALPSTPEQPRGICPTFLHEGQGIRPKNQLTAGANQIQ